MKLNIANPSAGTMKIVEFDDPKALYPFMDKRMATEVPGESLGDAYKGYVFKITGGNDKDGFPMMQGVASPGRVRLLFKKGMKTYRERRHGQMKRKSVRGCITGMDLSVLNLVIVKKGDADLPGLTDTVVPCRLGPKRASKIRKLFALSKKDDVRKYVIKREVAPKAGKTRPSFKAPKIQRLVTPQRLQRKRAALTEKKRASAKSKADAAEYHKLLKQRAAETRAKRQSSLSSKRRSQLSTGAGAAPAAAAKTAAPVSQPATEKKVAAVEKKVAAPAVAEKKKAAVPAASAAAPSAAKKTTAAPEKKAEKKTSSEKKPAPKK